jgi:cephalosporin hydroxylase
MGTWHKNRKSGSYNFAWMGRPIIRYPADVIAMQEIIWEIRPDLIIETGIAHGGGLIFASSMLELLGGAGRVVGVDIDIRAHNKEAILNHPLAKRITLLEGSSESREIIEQIRAMVKPKDKVLVVLDSLHTHDHVLRELIAYADLVTLGAYIIVSDTFIEDFPKGYFADRPWDVGNNPQTAVDEFLRRDSRFILDRDRSSKLLISDAANGYLRRVR